MMQNKKGKIVGDTLRISSATVEDFIARLEGTKGFIDHGFMDEYQLHIIMKQRIARAAKVFLIKNWERVKDWSKLHITVSDNSKKRTEYYNHVPRTIEFNDEDPKDDNSIMRRMDIKLEKWLSEKHNPVVSMDIMVLDPTDEDFSITINGIDHNWISDDSVIVLADYAERWLKENSID